MRQERRKEFIMATSTTAKLSQRLFFVDMLHLMNGDPTEFSLTELAEFAQGRIDKIDETNAKAKSADRKPTPKELAAQEENARLREALVAIVREATEPLVRDAIAEAMGVTPAKVSALAKGAINEGMIGKTEVKIDGKSRVAYTGAVEG